MVRATKVLVKTHPDHLNATVPQASNILPTRRRAMVCFFPFFFISIFSYFTQTSLKIVKNAKKYVHSIFIFYDSK